MVDTWAVQGLPYAVFGGLRIYYMLLGPFGLVDYAVHKLQYLDSNSTVDDRSPA